MARRNPALLPAAARHLADRFTYGVTPALATEILGFTSNREWFEAQLTRSQPQNLRATLVPTWFPLLANAPTLSAILAQQALRGAYQVGNELIARNLALRILSTHQVYETMCDFWANFLYIPASEPRSFAWRVRYDDEVVRKHALGTYREMLRAAVVHPAMAGYLTNDLNQKAGINENLGRELLELHTVGAIYSEDDVLNSSRLLTGYTVAVTSNFAAGYDANRHWVGPVKVLDFTHPNAEPDGRAALGEYLDYLAMHPATARRIAQRLCVRFVSDQPPRAVVDAVARTYLRSGSDIKACLRTLVAHRAFRRSVRSKARTPSDDVVHTARVLGLTPAGAPTANAFIYQLIGQAGAMGQISLRWPAPDGWPEQTQGYLSASRVLRSWRTHLDLAGTTGTALIDVDVATKASQLPQTWPKTFEEVIDHQSQRIIGQPAGAAVVAAIVRSTGIPAAQAITGPDDLTDLQYRLLRGTVLNSPAGLQR
ncbi:unannotated protein [freshwater metagenome]|uniref:Unannotated protein n=1 Tax=freshwater metagenome TaxID=449393 RepID=A0A6J6R324_9ZZZZ